MSDEEDFIQRTERTFKSLTMNQVGRQRSYTISLSGGRQDLERQLETANQALEQREQEFSLVVDLGQTLLKRAQDAEDEQDRLAELVDNMNRDLKESHDALAASQSTVNSLSDTVDKLRKEATRLEAMVTSLQDELVAAKQGESTKLNDALAKVRSLTNEQKDYERDNENLKDLLKKLETENQTRKESEQTLKRKLAEVQHELVMVTESRRLDVQNLLDENAALNVQIHSLSEKAKNLTAALEEARDTSMELERREHQLETELKSAKSSLTQEQLSTKIKLSLAPVPSLNLPPRAPSPDPTVHALLTPRSRKGAIENESLSMLEELEQHVRERMLEFQPTGEQTDAGALGADLGIGTPRRGSLTSADAQEVLNAGTVLRAKLLSCISQVRESLAVTSMKHLNRTIVPPLPPLQLLERSTAALMDVLVFVGTLPSAGSEIIMAVVDLLKENVGLRIELNAYAERILSTTMQQVHESMKGAIKVMNPRSAPATPRGKGA